MSGSHYDVTARIDWIRSCLEDGEPFNSTILNEHFGTDPRTCRRDMQYLRRWYGKRLKYDFKHRTFYLR